MAQDFVGAFTGLLVMDIAYVLGTIIVFNLYDVTASTVTSEFTAGTLPALLEAWVAAGALLGLGTPIAIFALITGMLNGAGGGARR